jgi:hypothetical protein
VKFKLLTLLHVVTILCAAFAIWRSRIEGFQDGVRHTQNAVLEHGFYNIRQWERVSIPGEDADGKPVMIYLATKPDATGQYPIHTRPVTTSGVQTAIASYRTWRGFP